MERTESLAKIMMDCVRLCGPVLLHRLEFTRLLCHKCSFLCGKQYKSFPKESPLLLHFMMIKLIIFHMHIHISNFYTFIMRIDSWSCATWLGLDKIAYETDSLVHFQIFHILKIYESIYLIFCLFSLHKKTVSIYKVK